MQGYIWAVRAVRIQDAPDDCEKITDSAFFKSSLNCGRAIPFTELFTANMWMCDFLVCGSRIWLKGNHKVRTAVVQLIELVQVHLNLERTQIDILQSDWFCDNGDVVFRGVELDITKFLLESI
jgi:hypothetical protein